MESISHTGISSDHHLTSQELEDILNEGILEEDWEDDECEPPYPLEQFIVILEQSIPTISNN